MRVWDAATGRQRRKFRIDSWVRDIAVSLDAKLLAGSGKMLQRWVLPSSVGGAVAFSADGRLFATSIEEPSRRIQVYEIASGKVRLTIEGYRGRVWSLALWPDGRRLASGQSDSSVLVWDLTAPEHARKG